MINNPKMTKEEVENYKQHDVLEAYLGNSFLIIFRSMF